MTTELTCCDCNGTNGQPHPEDADFIVDSVRYYEDFGAAICDDCAQARADYADEMDTQRCCSNWIATGRWA